MYPGLNQSLWPQRQSYSTWWGLKSTAARLRELGLPCVTTWSESWGAFQGQVFINNSPPFSTWVQDNWERERGTSLGSWSEHNDYCKVLHQTLTSSRRLPRVKGQTTTATTNPPPKSCPLGCFGHSNAQIVTIFLVWWSSWNWGH